MKLNNLSPLVPGDPGSKQRLGTHKHRSQGGLSPLSLVSPAFLTKLLRSVDSAGSALWATGERSRIYEYFMTSKRTRDTGDTRDNPPWERSFAVPSVKMSQGTNGFYRGQRWPKRACRPVLFTGKGGGPSCDSEIPRLDDCPLSLNPRWPLDPSNHSNSAESSAKHGSETGSGKGPTNGTP